MSDLFLLINIVLPNLAKNPNNGQSPTSDFATNLNGYLEPNIGISK